MANKWMIAKSILLLDTGREWGGGNKTASLKLLKRLDKERYQINGHFSTIITGDRTGTSSLSSLVYGIPCICMERTKMSRG